ncbi:MAG: VOC family protein [Kofleriaceae bacterium]|nr:VOC family protein [Kofleriaceae bacterium]MCL4224211.1 VOC family protein [Myxococcales bacterium]
MIDHVSVYVDDLAAARAFYSQALAPLGYTVLMEFPGALGLGVAPKPDLWVIAGGARPGGQHVALRASGRAAVRAFHEAALAAGGKDNGPPGVRAQYHPSYFGAFVLDPSGNNLEACCHEPYLE